MIGRRCKADRLHPLIPRESPRWWKLYKGRAAVEREFGRLKNEWALLPLRVRGLDQVALHADLTILAKLSCALARARRPGVRLVCRGLGGVKSVIERGAVASRVGSTRHERGHSEYRQTLLGGGTAWVGHEH